MWLHLHKDKIRTLAFAFSSSVIYELGKDAGLQHDNYAVKAMVSVEDSEVEAA